MGSLPFFCIFFRFRFGLVFAPVHCTVLKANEILTAANPSWLRLLHNQLATHRVKQILNVF